MQLRYGQYTHANGETALNISRDTIYSSDKIAQSIMEKWIIDGKLIPTSSQSINGLVAGLSDAYSVDGLDLGLYDDGSRTSLYLDSKSCIGGTQVAQHPSFPTSRDAALVTNMPYKITVRGERPITTRESLLVSFRETIRRSGGGPLFGYTETLYSLPVPQRRRRHTIFRATQSGSAVGRYGYPEVPRAIWPASLVGNPKIVEIGPKRRAGGDNENYEVQWVYNFESHVSMLGSPTRI